MVEDDASTPDGENLPDRRHQPARRSNRDGPDMRFEINIVDDEEADRLARQQAKAILGIAAWRQDQQAPDRDVGPPPTLK